MSTESGLGSSQTLRHNRVESLLEALERVVPVPAEHRTWISEDAAIDCLRCDRSELLAARDAGLATRAEDYERYDVLNLALAEGKQHTQIEREMVFFGRLLRSHGRDWTSPFDYQIVAEARCPREADCQDGQWLIAPSIPGVRWMSKESGSGYAVWEGSITLEGRCEPILSPLIARVWDEFLVSYRYQFTPYSLANDVVRTRERKVGDCFALSRVLADELNVARGNAVVVPGYIYGGSRARRHMWVEVLDDDGAMKSLDPSMALLAESYFTEEFRGHCFGSRLNRIIRLESEADFNVNHICSEGAVRTHAALRLKPVRV